MRSAKYNTVKNFFDKGLWNKTRVRNAVTKGWITEEEYDMIINGEEAEAQQEEVPEEEADA